MFYTYEQWKEEAENSEIHRNSFTESVVLASPSVTIVASLTSLVRFTCHSLFPRSLFAVHFFSSLTEIFCLSVSFPLFLSVSGFFILSIIPIGASSVFPSFPLCPITLCCLSLYHRHHRLPLCLFGNLFPWMCNMEKPPSLWHAW